MTTLDIKNLSVMIGPNPQKTLKLADQGLGREEIAKITNGILGVHNVNLKICSSELLVIMGLSGSGKSTLLRAIARLIPSTRGQIILEHQDQTYDLTTISGPKLRFVRRHLISMVFQQFALLPWRNVMQNISFGLEVSDIPKKERAVLIDDYLEMIGLTQYKEYPIAKLSGGMQQRVGLARALVTNAPILLMDEPFSALDPIIRNHLQDELKNLQTSLKKTIIFISHDLEEAIKLGNRIAIMKEGNIIQCDTPQNIILNPADDYVRNFTTHINPLSVLTAENVMNNLDSSNGDSFEHIVQAHTPLKEFIPLFKQSNTQIGVVKKGTIVGCIHAHDILDCLAHTAKL